jgi:hypothetical protein
MSKQSSVSIWLALFALVCPIRIVGPAEEELGRRYAAMTRTLDVLELPTSRCCRTRLARRSAHAVPSRAMRRRACR